MFVNIPPPYPASHSSNCIPENIPYPPAFINKYNAPPYYVPAALH